MYKATRGKHITNAYLAGIIDGEGSIFITRINNKRSGNIWYRFQLSCAMTEPGAIRMLIDTFTPNNKQYIYVGGRKYGYKPSYQWLTTGSTAVKVLKALLPYLTVKKKQAELGIAFQTWRSGLPNTGKPRSQEEMKEFEKYYFRMKALK